MCKNESFVCVWFIYVSDYHYQWNLGIEEIMCLLNVSIIYLYYCLCYCLVVIGLKGLFWKILTKIEGNTCINTQHNNPLVCFQPYNVILTYHFLLAQTIFSSSVAYSNKNGNLLELENTVTPSWCTFFDKSYYKNQVFNCLISFFSKF